MKYFDILVEKHIPCVFVATTFRKNDDFQFQGECKHASVEKAFAQK